jgi:homoserine O-acetyltransferase
VSFKNRFDANSYLYLSKALDMFDLASGPDGLVGVFRSTGARFCVIAFSSDWLQPPEESRKIVRALTMCNADVSFVVITTDNGHDAFLLDEPEMFSVIRGFIDATYRLRVEGGPAPAAAVGA